MALSDIERLLFEEMKTLLGDKTQLGLSVHKKDQQDQSNTGQWLHEDIDQQFALDTIDLVHHSEVTAAFKKVHDYKYLDSPTFQVSFRRELTAQAVPAKEVDEALKILEKLMVKAGGKKGQGERDAGWHPELEEVLKTANPE